MAENTNLLNPASNNFFSENNFLYKAIFVSILVLVIPLFIPASTQEAPPDFVNKTTSWEVVQLVLVGIAVSYGLFSSKRNDQPKTLEKEDEHDQHAPLSYVSRLLQVPSSVFDDDDDEKHMVENNSKVVERTWNSQYYRGEPPIVVVAKESPSVDDANTTIEKLCLPPSVGRGRSLKPSPNNNNNNTKEGDNYYYYRKSLSSISGSSSSFSTGTGKRRFSRNLSCPEEETKEEDNIVLRSPVPWRSRSGRMQLKEEEEKEIQSKSLHEDVVVRKKMYPQSSTIPPPPPPPPPPRPPQRLVLLNNNKSRINTSTTTRYAPHNQDSQNRARQGGRLVEDVTPTHKYHHTLSHDKEIESFIQTRGGSQKKNNTDDGPDDDDDDDDDEDDTQTQSFIEHPKKQQRQASASTRIKDSDQSSSSKDSEDEEDNDDELQELASTKSSHVINEEEMMLGSDHNVDKKADEFIAKFREQIRLQRIASIRSTATTQAKTKTGPTTG